MDGSGQTERKPERTIPIPSKTQAMIFVFKPFAFNIFHPADPSFCIQSFLIIVYILKKRKALEMQSSCCDFVLVSR